MESIFGGNNKKPNLENSSIFGSHQEIDPENELARINQRLLEIDNIPQEDWNDDLSQEVKKLQQQRENLEGTISKQRPN